MNLKIEILAFAACALLSSCSHETNVAYQDKKVKVLHKEEINYLSVHSSHDEMWLVAFGKTYKKVRGQAPFYLEIPGKDSILFVTGREFNDGQATVHFLNYKTGKEIHFPAYDSHIGSNISAKKTPNQSEKIQSVKGGKVVIGATFLDRQYRYYLDLEKPEFEKEEGSDPIHQRETNFHVWNNGKNPRK